jgi:hypothetical protein
MGNGKTVSQPNTGVEEPMRPTDALTGFRACLAASTKWLAALLALTAAASAERLPLEGLQVRVIDAQSDDVFVADIPESLELDISTVDYRAFVTEFPREDVAIRVLLAARYSAAYCSVTVTTDREEMRQVSIEVSVPGPAPDGLVWMPADDFPRSIGQTSERLDYRGDFEIPILCAYVSGEGIATSLVMPFEGLYPHLRMGWGRMDWGPRRWLVAETSHLRLQRDRAAHTAAWIVKHAPDWRPALDWVLRRYPEYFSVKAQAFPDGPMVVGQFMNSGKLAYLQRLGFRWTESDLLRTPYYGAYTAHSADGGAVAAAREFIRRASSYGLDVFAYWQSLEMRPEPAEAWFPDARFTRPDGTAPPEGHLGQYVWMVPDPSRAWYAHITGQVFDMLDLLPNVSGVFCDNNLHSGFSYGQDDGISAAGGERIVWGHMQEEAPGDEEGAAPRAVCQFAFAQAQTLSAVRTRLTMEGKGLWANHVADVATMRDVDGLMVEGLRFIRQKYAGLRRPMVCITYYDLNDRARLEKLDSALRRILFAGMQPGFNEWEVEALDSPVLRAYLPLFRQLRGRAWVLDPDPVRAVWHRHTQIPCDVFRRADGAYIVLLGPNPRGQGNVTVSLTVPEFPARRVAFVRGLEDAMWTGAKLSTSPLEWEIAVSQHRDITMLVVGEEPYGNP